MIAIIDYGAGNVRSVQNAIERLGERTLLTADAAAIHTADKVIFPGVGEARSAMQALRATGLHTLIPTLQQPVLGICLGLQLMCSHTEENDTEGLGIFKTAVKRFPEKANVPHTGWNNFTSCESVLMRGVPMETDVYYVHSYYAELCTTTVATCDYILPFSAVLQRDNFYATQFHPEKSAAAGQRILQNFLAL